MNILVFMTDDHGQWASGCYGNQEVQTPNMDFLAETGARMTNAFTPSPVCSPARACFFTGRLPSQHGIHDWIKEENRTLPWIEHEKPLPAVLQEGGYHTGLVGKWHCGRSDLPHAGFAYTFSHATHQFPHCGEFRFLENGQTVAFRGQQAAKVTSKAQQFLRERDRSRPFFLFVGYVDTHAPFERHPERLARRYRKASFVDIPQETYHGPGRIVFSLSQDEMKRREELAQYYAAVTYIDEQIGILLDELEGTDDLDDTLVVYTSDHGHMNGHHGLSTKGNATVPQNFLEESIRVPCLLRWPGPIQAQRSHDLFVDHCDLFQTLLDAAGCRETEEAAKRRHSPGRSYLPPLTGAAMETPWRAEQCCEYGNARMIRTDRYKLIVRYPPHSERFSDELYDLQEDPRENVNAIADSNRAEIVEELRARLESFFDRYEEPERSGRDILARPIHNPNEPWRAPLTTPRP
ncbi:MAG TPA: sulfatase-like hydrolase/transferase [Chthonomonadaceae bacterium]|nr:sulfatase-like hydrolase/transferase [Chthonomonadaceae bacterium]